MSRSLPQIGSDCPPLVKLIRYGILGGLAATPVSVAFRDFPADLLSHLWRAVVRDLPREQVVEVWSHAEIQRLKNDPYGARVVLMYSGHHRILSSNVLDWMVELRRTESRPLPAILSVYHRSSTDTPGATLVAQCDDELCNDLGRWLQHYEPLVKLPEVGFDEAFSVETGRLRSAVRQAAEGRSLTVRDIHIVTGLMTGAVINEAFHNGTLGQSIQAPGPGHYAEVHGLLNTRPFHTVDQPHDDLTLHMVARANFYLQEKAENTAAKPTRLGGRAGSTSTLKEDKSGMAERPRHITRRELVDLGNPNSSIAKRLIEKVVQSGDAGVLKRIGVEAAVRLRPSPRTRQPDASELVKSMTTWTYKMVRTRFDRLQSEGLIEARKAADNAAREYLVPEDLVNGRSHFAHLPDPKEVKTIYEST